MALSAKLQMRQSQALVMTPQLMQSIRLLQFTHAELERFIEDEVEKNPLLERPEPEQDGLAGDEPPQAAEDRAAGLDRMFEDAGASAVTISERLDASMENVFPDDPGTAERLGPDLAAQWKSAAAGGGGEDVDLDSFAAAGITLADHVGEQIAFAFRDPADRLIARELTDALDEGGYLRSDPAEIAERLGCGEEAVLAVLAVCRSFDPPGLFARDLAECLALQLRARDRFDPAMQAMVAHLDLVARRDPRPVRLAYAAGKPDNFACLPELAAAAALIDLRVLLVSETGAPGWQGETGLIDAARLAALLDGLAPGRALAMICGPGPMVTAVSDGLLDLGLAPGRVIYERFDYGGGTSRIDRRIRRRMLAALAGSGAAVAAFAQLAG